MDFKMDVDVDFSNSPIVFLNKLFNNGFKSLERCSKLRESLIERKARLQADADGSASGELIDPRSELSEIENADDVQLIESKVSDIQREIDEHIELVTSQLPHLSDLIEKSTKLERCQQYVKCLEHCEHLSCLIQSALLSETMDKALDAYEDFLAFYEKLRLSQCTGLIEFLQDTIKHWYNVLKDTVSRDLNVLMKSMKWPFVAVVAPVKQKPTSSETESQIKNQLTKLFKHLFRIQLPPSIPENIKVHQIIQSAPNYKPTLLPIALLVDPLRKRFQYHFYGAKQTNNLEKPEWFFTQLLSWAKDHSEYITTVIQPALWDAGYDFVNAYLEFLRSLHILAMEKMISCIPELLFEDHLYSHLIHEALSFHADMCRIHDYPADEPSCLHVLTAEEPFKKWINIERKFAQESMDTITGSASAWTCHYRSSESDEDDDQSKIAECAEEFVTLLTAITERYKPILYPVCQLMFVNMKTELLEDYRIRLVQLRKEFSAVSHEYSAILNTAHYLVAVLKDWSEQPFFLNLQYQKTELEQRSAVPIALPSLLSRNASYQLPRRADVTVIQDLECKLFDSTISNISRLEEDMLKALTHHIVADLKSKIRRYASNSNSMWTALNHLKHKEEQLLITMSASACDFVMFLQEKLVRGKEYLHRHLFTQYLQEIVHELDKLLFYMVISENYFSEGGAIQLNFDMTRNVFPLIGKYTTKPDNLMKMMKESCMLLTLQLGDALLLKSTLNDALHSLESSSTTQDPIATIQEMSIYRLSPEQVELVLSRRNDLLRNV